MASAVVLYFYKACHFIQSECMLYQNFIIKIKRFFYKTELILKLSSVSYEEYDEVASARCLAVLIGL